MALLPARTVAVIVPPPDAHDERTSRRSGADGRTAAVADADAAKLQNAGGLSRAAARATAKPTAGASRPDSPARPAAPVENVTCMGKA